MKVSQLKQLIKEAVKEAIKEELSEMKAPQAQPVQETVQQTSPVSTGDPIQDMLAETRRNMSRDEFRNVMNVDSTSAQGFMGQTPSMGQQPGLDLSKLDFAKKAGAIYKRSNEMDKQR